MTAEIKDATKRLWYVPIKNTIGDYFLADLAGQIYCFKIDSEICQYRETFTKSFRVVQYDTKHYRPMKSEVKELEMVLQKNKLPRVNNMLSDIFRVLGSREKDEEFTPHVLKDMIEKLSKYENTGIGKVIPKDQNVYATQIKSIINFLDNLKLEEIVTPVRGVSDYIEDDLKATDPRFLGIVGNTLQNMDFENKRVTNTPLTGKVAWLKFMLVFMMIGFIGFIIYYGYDQGWFEAFTDIGSSFEGISFPTPGGFQVPGEKNDKYYQDNFTPEELRAAIDRGEIDESDLPDATKEMVKNVELPVATPKN